MFPNDFQVGDSFSSDDGENNCAICDSEESISRIKDRQFKCDKCKSEFHYRRPIFFVTKIGAI